MRLGVLQYVPDELHQLYQLMELEYDPLSLCARVMSILTSLEENEALKKYIDVLKQYVDPLKEVTVVRLIKEVT